MQEERSNKQYSEGELIAVYEQLYQYYLGKTMQESCQLLIAPENLRQFDKHTITQFVFILQGLISQYLSEELNLQIRKKEILPERLVENINNIRDVLTCQMPSIEFDPRCQCFKVNRENQDIYAYVNPSDKRLIIDEKLNELHESINRVVCKGNKKANKTKKNNEELLKEFMQPFMDTMFYISSLENGQEVLENLLRKYKINLKINFFSNIEAEGFKELEGKLQELLLAELNKKHGKSSANSLAQLNDRISRALSCLKALQVGRLIFNQEKNEKIKELLNALFNDRSELNGHEDAISGSNITFYRRFYLELIKNGQTDHEDAISGSNITFYRCFYLELIKNGQTDQVIIFCQIMEHITNILAHCNKDELEAFKERSDCYHQLTTELVGKENFNVSSYLILPLNAINARVNQIFIDVYSSKENVTDVRPLARYLCQYEMQLTALFSDYFSFYIQQKIGQAAKNKKIKSVLSDAIAKFFYFIQFEQIDITDKGKVTFLFNKDRYYSPFSYLSRLSKQKIAELPKKIENLVDLIAGINHYNQKLQKLTKFVKNCWELKEYLGNGFSFEINWFNFLRDDFALPLPKLDYSNQPCTVEALHIDLHCLLEQSTISENKINQLNGIIEQIDSVLTKHDEKITNIMNQQQQAKTLPCFESKYQDFMKVINSNKKNACWKKLNGGQKRFEKKSLEEVSFDELKQIETEVHAVLVKKQIFNEFLPEVLIFNRVKESIDYWRKQGLLTSALEGTIKNAEEELSQYIALQPPIMENFTNSLQNKNIESINKLYESLKLWQQQHFNPVRKLVKDTMGEYFNNVIVDLIAIKGENAALDQIARHIGVKFNSHKMPVYSVADKTSRFYKLDKKTTVKKLNDIIDPTNFSSYLWCRFDDGVQVLQELEFLRTAGLCCQYNEEFKKLMDSHVTRLKPELLGYLSQQVQSMVEQETWLGIEDFCIRRINAAQYNFYKIKINKVSASIGDKANVDKLKRLNALVLLASKINEAYKLYQNYCALNDTISFDDSVCSEMKEFQNIDFLKFENSQLHLNPQALENKNVDDISSYSIKIDNLIKNCRQHFNSIKLQFDINNKNVLQNIETNAHAVKALQSCQFLLPLIEKLKENIAASELLQDKERRMQNALQKVYSHFSEIETQNKTIASVIYKIQQEAKLTSVLRDTIKDLITAVNENFYFLINKLVESINNLKPGDVYCPVTAKTADLFSYAQELGFFDINAFKNPYLPQLKAVNYCVINDDFKPLIAELVDRSITCYVNSKEKREKVEALLGKINSCQDALQDVLGYCEKLNPDFLDRTYPSPFFNFSKDAAIKKITEEVETIVFHDPHGMAAYKETIHHNYWGKQELNDILENEKDECISTFSVYSIEQLSELLGKGNNAHSHLLQIKRHQDIFDDLHFSVKNFRKTVKEDEISNYNNQFVLKLGKCTSLAINGKELSVTEQLFQLSTEDLKNECNEMEMLIKNIGEWSKEIVDVFYQEIAEKTQKNNEQAEQEKVTYNNSDCECLLAEEDKGIFCEREDEGNEEPDTTQLLEKINENSFLSLITQPTENQKNIACYDSNVNNHNSTIKTAGNGKRQKDSTLNTDFIIEESSIPPQQESKDTVSDSSTSNQQEPPVVDSDFSADISNADVNTYYYPFGSGTDKKDPQNLLLPSQNIINDGNENVKCANDKLDNTPLILNGSLVLGSPCNSSEGYESDKTPPTEESFSSKSDSGKSLNEEDTRKQNAKFTNGKKGKQLKQHQNKSTRCDNITINGEENRQNRGAISNSNGSAKKIISNETALTNKKYFNNKSKVNGYSDQSLLQRLDSGESLKEEDARKQTVKFTNGKKGKQLTQYKNKLTSYDNVAINGEENRQNRGDIRSSSSSSDDEPSISNKTLLTDENYFNHEQLLSDNSISEHDHSDAEKGVARSSFSQNSVSGKNSQKKKNTKQNAANKLTKNKREEQSRRNVSSSDSKKPAQTYQILDEKLKKQLEQIKNNDVEKLITNLYSLNEDNLKKIDALLKNFDFNNKLQRQQLNLLRENYKLLEWCSIVIYRLNERKYISVNDFLEEYDWTYYANIIQSRGSKSIGSSMSVNTIMSHINRAKELERENDEQSKQHLTTAALLICQGFAHQNTLYDIETIGVKFADFFNRLYSKLKKVIEQFPLKQLPKPSASKITPKSTIAASGQQNKRDIGDIKEVQGDDVVYNVLLSQNTQRLFKPNKGKKQECGESIDNTKFIDYCKQGAYARLQSIQQVIGEAGQRKKPTVMKSWRLKIM